MLETPAPTDAAASEHTEWLLKVTDLKQFAYCPRIPYYHYCLPEVRPTTHKMDAGIRAQDRAEERERRRSLRAYGLTEGERRFNVSITSGQLGVSGQIDLVIKHSVNGEDRLVPVDYKLSRRNPGRHFKLQLACYALLLEEVWDLPVEDGFLYLIPARRAVRVPITTRLRNDVRRQLAEIRALVLAERMPLVPPKQRSRCVDCEFRRFCNDVL
ncbi:MAG: CRISPR-associated protein Cas4 [Caldilineaceae bacterium SB0670_bin_27]|uniref:CRISPR-associated exonuclease Cas4 n=1 Tax=Caldilineaceae bacterium SB0664_bin_27 TaxID=2605260 RepID=A0A6B0YQ52_9CHLR|nr:CRISPR-associated protein Cas4 [Caldilineaceae bacterium SB0664_bin_27]MYJ80112.1 CRISPR-associated protein Cas4 [Caldilineaceae bacterium SB0670_bin_27]